LPPLLALRFSSTFPCLVAGRKSRPNLRFHSRRVISVCSDEVRIREEASQNTLVPASNGQPTGVMKDFELVPRFAKEGQVAI
jgi:hypothetical protein